VYSVINRSPRHLLKEVILVDDQSELDELKKPLDDYCEGKLYLAFFFFNVFFILIY
jgi:hypothetical protein